MALDELERGHTYTFKCEYQNEQGQLYDPTETGAATAKIYRRDELVATLSTTKEATGKWKAKWSISSDASLEEHYVQWGWSDSADPICGRYKFRVVHTGINK